MARLPAVADRFYPGNSSSLTREVQSLMGEAPQDRLKALAVVSPHAGYLYSGSVAAETLNSVVIPESVIIFGPNHHGRGADISLSMEPWQMPMGDVPIDTPLAKRLLSKYEDVKVDESAHQYEHSLEVQVPFLQAMQKNLKIIPLVLSRLSFQDCEKLAACVAESIIESGKKVLIVASSDMTHYEPRQVAVKKDSLALDRLLGLDPAGLYKVVTEQRITMCGFIPATVAALASLKLGAKQAKLVRYTDSGEVSGDTDQVVGYAGIIIS